MNIKLLIRGLKIIIFIGCFPMLGLSQNFLNSGSVQGNFQLDAQYYQKDSAIGANEVSEKMLMNAFANIIYTNGNFSTGLRYESYRNPMLGFDNRYKGSGIAYRYATYKADEFEITVGNFYEQFGSGMIFRSYEESAGAVLVEFVAVPDDATREVPNPAGKGARKVLSPPPQRRRVLA